MKRITLVAFLSALALPAAAYAHVTANPSEATAGSFAMITFRVPHGCEDSPTTGITVKIPDGVVFVTPEAVPGWTVSTKEGKLAQPVEAEGETITEGATEVSWSGGPLSPHEFTDFGLSMKLPDKAGETLWFPVVQRCEQGRTRWIKIPVEGQAEPDTPAPGVSLVAASTPTPAAAPVAAADDEESDDDETATTVALLLGAAGLLAGLAALGLVLFRRPRQGQGQGQG
jgi:periplasmic copper chaperone A